MLRARKGGKNVKPKNRQTSSFGRAYYFRCHPSPCFVCEKLFTILNQKELIMYDDDDFDDSAKGFDEIESSLLKDDFYGNVKFNGNNGADLGKKINLSVKVQNDITRSEKKGEKRASHYGRDDRATSEQVLDPRTRLILFKLLSNGFLTEIDGKSLLILSYWYCYWLIFNICCVLKRRLLEYWKRS
jgi:hypothetical protein